MDAGKLDERNCDKPSVSVNNRKSELVEMCHRDMKVSNQWLI